MLAAWLSVALAFVSPAHAGVAVSAEAGADASVPKISLQTSLSPALGPSLGATLNPVLLGSLSISPAPTLAAPSLAVPALPVSVVAAHPVIPAAPRADPEAAAGPTDKSPPASEAERLDREFAKIDTWGQIAPSARAEIEGLRARKTSKAELTAYVQAEADAAIERIKAARGLANIGLHYNLHGGFVPLDSKHGEHLFIKMRMGYALSLFDLDAPAFKEARAHGRITNSGAISIDFHGMKGVPYEAYLAPPVEVFTKTAKKIGMGRLSWDEETLATVRYLEAAVLQGAPTSPASRIARLPSWPPPTKPASSPSPGAPTSANRP